MWWLLPTALSVGANIYSGISASNTANANAESASDAGYYNASAITKAGDMNAAMELATGRMSADLLMGQTAVKLAANQAIRSYNAGLSLMVAEYNANLNEREASLLWEEAELEMFQMGQEFERRKGSVVAGFASSGVDLNFGTPQDVIVDGATQHELDKMIVRHGADIQAGKFLDAAARSRWEGKVQADKMMWEGRISDAAMVATNTMTAQGAVFQSGLNARALTYNAGIQAGQAIWGGQSAAFQYRQQGSQAITSSLLNSVSSGLSTGMAAFNMWG